MIVNVSRQYATATTRALSKPLAQYDPDLYKLIIKERERQRLTVNLIASENFTPRYCSDALASCASMKYSEGLPGDRYYAGNEHIDNIERLCQSRALRAFDLDPNEWSVNVQALSGSPANFAVFTGILSPKDKIMFMNLPDGGHLSHGFKGYSGSGSLTATARYFKTIPYHLDRTTELIDYEEVAALAEKHKPKLLIAGASAYPRLIDYRRFAEIADKHQTFLLSDIAHIAGLMSAKVIPSAFEHSHVVTTTTHKTLRGPRGALVFMRKDLAAKINKAIFPGCQGGPHNHTISAIAAALRACKTEEYVDYQRQVLRNSRVMAEEFQKRSYRVVTGGTDNHIVLIDLSTKGVTGGEAEMALELAGVIANKNSVLSDRSPKNPSGLRLGSPAMTCRGLKEEDFSRITHMICDVLDMLANGKKLNDIVGSEEYTKIKKEVEVLSGSFPVIESSIYA